MYHHFQKSRNSWLAIFAICIDFDRRFSKVLFDFTWNRQNHRIWAWTGFHDLERWSEMWFREMLTIAFGHEFSVSWPIANVNQLNGSFISHFYLISNMIYECWLSGKETLNEWTVYEATFDKLLIASKLSVD